MIITAVYDACVFYPAALRDLLMNIASAGLCRARWTEEIHDEWISALLKNRSDIKPSALAITRELINNSVRDAVVTHYQSLIRRLSLPDPNDRHVLAAAIEAKAKVIVTNNLADFPAEVLAPYGIVAEHPDIFVMRLMAQDKPGVIAAVRRQRKNLKRPAKTAEQLLASLHKLHMKKTVATLRQHLDEI
ncbi:MAG: PIN domain-containing protein [Pseudomonadota bacterium]|nr:PIN domain-containing protein [Pseudomonadota bacterium]